jgi:DNA-3-methyladenine glycosylase
MVEVEAYLGDGTDPGSHSHRGPTPRNLSMFGPPGRLYTYRSYGIHTCANVVCEAEGRGAAVLLRALEPLAGAGAMRRLRGLPEDAGPRSIARGPARLCQALALTLDDDGRTALGGELTFRSPRTEGGGPVEKVVRGPRVGLSKGAQLPYRFYLADSRWVSPWRAGGRPTKSR